ncbi:MAG: hypothetical protein HXX10_07615 [Rhodoplanes sp.]|uniref:hypothetical protein n=1 Tax=Rhodoplanes sp. TaxID=1968906 RepID=UPI0017D5B84C|nr:hypothetical protein [Rhodoplanes sp.]NVO13888.1 hypothetical protein [Rhodoplanes sp.]
MAKPYKYADDNDDSPVLLGETEAWTIAFEKWTRMDHTEAFANARLLSKSDFEEMYPDLPPLPAEAFAD